MKNLFILLLLLSSCKSFLLTGKEEFKLMCIRDSGGCSFKNVEVITTKTGFTSQTLSFKAITNKDTIMIPRLEFNYNKPNYTGIGLNKVKYTVTYLETGKNTTISIHSVKGNITLSTKNICSIYEF